MLLWCRLLIDAATCCPRDALFLPRTLYATLVSSATGPPSARRRGSTPRLLVFSGRVERAASAQVEALCQREDASPPPPPLSRAPVFCRNEKHQSQRLVVLSLTLPTHTFIPPSLLLPLHTRLPNMAHMSQRKQTKADDIWSANQKAVSRQRAMSRRPVNADLICSNLSGDGLDCRRIHPAS